MKHNRINLAVVGCGVIGNSLASLLKDMGYLVKQYDPVKGLIDDISECEIIFVCVPTKADMKFKDVKMAVNYITSKNKKGI